MERIRDLVRYRTRTQKSQRVESIRKSLGIAFLAGIALSLLIPNANAAQATLSWVANTDPAVVGYKLYYSNESGIYSQSVDVGNATSYTVNNLSDGKTYFFSAVAYDAWGHQSDYSNEVSKSIPASAPVEYTIQASAGTGGTITPTGSIAVGSGTSKSFSIIPSAGYKIAAVIVDGTSVGTVSTYSFTNITANHTISATFAFQETSVTPHWKDATTAKTTMLTASPSYMVWSPVVADTTANVNTLRVSVALYGQATQVRLALYDQSGTKLTEGTGIVSAAGYKTINVPSVRVVEGNTYYIAIQAASSLLKKFDSGGKTGGFAAKNNYSSGFPSTLPNGWGDYLVTSGMYVQ